MKTFWPILSLLLVAGCGAKSGGDVNAGGGDAPPQELTPNLEAVEANSAAHVQALIDRALPAELGDAKGAQYRNVRAGAGGAACGEVSGKTTHGFVPFVVTPSAIAVVAKSPVIAYADPSDFFADAWIRWCATPEELKSVAAAVQKAKPDAVPANLALPLPVPEASPGAPPQTPRAAPAKPPPPPQIGSFFNSVARGK